jgi:hypothetical protein
MGKSIQISILTTADLKGVQDVTKALDALSKAGGKSGGADKAAVGQAQAMAKLATASAQAAIAQDRVAVSAEKVAQAHNQTSVSALRVSEAENQVAVSVQRVAQAESQAATAAENFATAQARTATATAQTEAAQNRAAITALRLADAQEKAQNKVSGFGKSIKDISGGLGQLGVAFGASQVIEFVDSSRKASDGLNRQLNVTRELAGSTQAYDAIIGQARQQQELFGGTLQENVAGMQGLVVTARSSGAELKTLIDLSQRLAVLDPAQGAEGARVALSEVLSGDPRSLARRYEIPLDALDKIKDESIPAAQRLVVLDQYLNKIGITSKVVGSTVTDQEKAFNRLTGSIDTLKTSLGALASVKVAPLADDASKIINFLTSGKDAALAFKGALDFQGAAGLASVAGTLQEFGGYAEKAAFGLANLVGIQTQAQGVTQLWANAIKEVTGSPLPDWLAQLLGVQQDQTNATQQAANAAALMAQRHGEQTTAAYQASAADALSAAQKKVLRDDTADATAMLEANAQASAASAVQSQADSLASSIRIFSVKEPPLV